MQGKVVKYKGNEKFICALLKIKDEYSCLYGLINEFTIKSTEEKQDCYAGPGLGNCLIASIVTGYKIQGLIDFALYNNKFFTIIPLKKEEDFELIYTVLESLFN